MYGENRLPRVATVLLSTQQAHGKDQGAIRDYVVANLAPRALGKWHSSEIEFVVNPSGSFEIGGPTADCGVTVPGFAMARRVASERYPAGSTPTSLADSIKLQKSAPALVPRCE